MDNKNDNTKEQKINNIEYEDLETLERKDFDELHDSYGINNVEYFLFGI